MIFQTSFQILKLNFYSAISLANYINPIRLQFNFLTHKDTNMNLQFPLDPKFNAYRHIQIIKCKQNKIIVIGSSGGEQFAAIIFNKTKFYDETTTLKDTLTEIDPKPSYDQIKTQIQKIIGNFHIKQSIAAFGIVGFHKFLQGYYLTYISQIEVCAKIGEHKIYTIKNTAILPLFEFQSQRKVRKNQQKYVEILEEFKLENFYFSTTYDLSNSLAKNMIRNSKQALDFKPDDQTLKSPEQSFKTKDNSSKWESPEPEKVLDSSDIFTFNYELIKQFHNSIKNKRFVLPVTHGYCKHISISFLTKMQISKALFLISSQLQEEVGIMPERDTQKEAQVRMDLSLILYKLNKQSSITPLFKIQGQSALLLFKQEALYRPIGCRSPVFTFRNPLFKVLIFQIPVKSDDYMFLATRKHFNDLICRYGGLIYAINLMKTKQKLPRQSLLSKQYQTAVSFINKWDMKQQNQIHYIQVDMKYHLRLDKKLFVNKIKTIAYFAIQNTGLFMCMNPSTSSREQFVEIQNGIIRANCVDCLDRTNSFQQLVGQTALAIQLNRLIKQNVSFQSLELPDKILDEYSKLYEEMGDLISIQYGSSLAHKQKIQKSTQSRFQFLIAITRHVNNNWNDYDRQEQMDVFLGYKPDPKGAQIWEVKPAIEHYPQKQLQKLERTNWSEDAYNQFLMSYCIKDFRSINNKQDYQRDLPCIERFLKQDLVSKFNVDIVNSLVNQRQNFSLLQFFVMPQLSAMKKLFQKKNENIRKPQTLKQQLQFCYNRLDFFKSSEQPKSSLASQKKIRSELPNEIRKNFGGKTTKPSTSFYIEDKGNNALMIRNTEKAIEGDYLDETQIKIVQRYMLGDLIQDFQIEQEIQSYMQFLGQEVQRDWPSQQQIQKELKNLQANMNNKIYLNFSQTPNEGFNDLIRKKKKTMIDMTSMKTLQVQHRNQKMKQNKILILEQIMKKNFSHGNVQRIQEI